MNIPQITLLCYMLTRWFRIQQCRVTGGVGTLVSTHTIIRECTSGKLTVDIVRQLWKDSGKLWKDSGKFKPEDASRGLLNTLNGKFSDGVVNVDDFKR